LGIQEVTAGSFAKGEGRRKTKVRISKGGEENGGVLRNKKCCLPFTTVKIKVERMKIDDPLVFDLLISHPTGMKRKAVAEREKSGLNKDVVQVLIVIM